MLFNSYEFIFLYLPIVFAGFFVIAKASRQFAALWLASASLFFYGWWNPQFVSLLLLSIVFNYGAGYLIGHSRSRKAKVVLTISILVNLVLLTSFKYADFFISTANSAGANLEILGIILPLGISFFTFTQIAFLVDVHRGIAREYNFIHYLLFVTWFPHLIAGPVIHHKQMMPQLAHEDTYRPRAESISVGLTLFAFGLFKKTMLADQFALFAQPVFDSAAGGAQPMFVAAWVGALAYTLQIYFDFSGYSDMAIGLSRMFNVKLPLNFDSPYKASNIIDFWHRWHMTLSKFLRDYLYIPLGGNRKGPVRRHINLLVTMLLGGLWHGAGWNFVLWGGLHGIYLVINHAWRWLTGSTGKPGNATTHAFAVLCTFTAVVIAWVPFRANSMDATMAIWKGMFGLNGISLSASLVSQLGNLGGHIKFLGWMPGINIPTLDVVMWLPTGLLIIWCLPNTQQCLAKFSPAWEVVNGSTKISWTFSRLNAFFAGTLLAISIISLSRTSEFLYFRF